MHTYIIDISAILSIPVELYQNNQSSAKVPTVLPPVMYIYRPNKSPIVSKEKGKGGKKKEGSKGSLQKKKPSGAENAAKKERTEKTNLLTTYAPHREALKPSVEGCY